MAADRPSTDQGSSNRSAREGTSDSKQRLADLQRQQKRQSRKGPIIAAVIAVVVILAIVISVVMIVRGGGDDEPSTSGSAAIGEVKSYSGLSQDHIQSGYKYEQTPPVGGAHNPVWANCGVYDKTIPNQYAVHSLEHGAVWITYKKSLPKSQVNELASKVRQQGNGYMLMSQVDDQSTPVVMTAWGKQMHLRDAKDTGKIDSFIKSYLQGPQTPEPGAACSGGYDPNTGKIGGQ